MLVYAPATWSPAVQQGQAVSSAHGERIQIFLQEWICGPLTRVAVFNAAEWGLVPSMNGSAADHRFADWRPADHAGVGARAGNAFAARCWRVGRVRGTQAKAGGRRQIAG